MQRKPKPGDGQARPRQGRATIRDVAERAGVSTATVSRILNGSYPPAPATRGKVIQAVADLDYVANPHARALLQQRTGTIAIVVSAIDEGVLATIVQTVAREAADAGRLSLIATTGYDPQREMAVLRQVHAQNVDAIILIAGIAETDGYRRSMTAFAETLQATQTRLVLCARPPVGPDVPAAVVEYDNVGGAYAATSHLLSRGHRRILFLGGPDGHSTTTRRLDGYLRALADLGGDADPRLQLRGPASRSSATAAVRDVLKAGSPNFTAVFTWNDHLAAGAVQALREAGLRMPEDVSVVGFDDIDFAADLGLTTVHIPARELGRVAVSMALDPDDPTRQTMLGTHVIVRGSVHPR